TRCIFENPVAFVVKESITGRTKDTRRAIVSRSRGGITVRTIRNRKISVVDDHQIEPAVAVVIEERCARAPAQIISATLFGDVNKLSIAFVQIHLIGTEIREVQVRQAIVVDVTNGCAHAVTGGCNAALFRDVSECECMFDIEIVAEEFASRRTNSLRIRIENVALNEKPIEVTVVIEIE